MPYDFSDTPAPACDTDATMESPVYQWVSEQSTDLRVDVTAIGYVKHDWKNAKEILDDLKIRNTLFEKKQQFSLSAIKAALDRVLDDKRNERLDELRTSLKALPQDDPDELHKLLADLMAYATDEADNGFTADEAARLIEKFIWQVKCKMHNRPVANHLMLVFVGTQGGGKSELLRRLTGPVAEVTASTDFAEISDNRNCQLFAHYVGVIDELDRADRANVESLKRIITETVVTRRVLGTGLSVGVRQNMTMIGTANRDIAEAIVDETGNRRYAQINVIGKSNPRRPEFWKRVNAFDWLGLWRSVDEMGPDPAAGIVDRVADVQSAQRTLSPIEMWYDARTEARYHAITSPDLTTIDSLYLDFQDWERVYAPQYITPLMRFRHTFIRMCRDGVLPWREAKTNGKRGWRRA